MSDVIDRKDEKILKVLKKNSKLSMGKIAKKTGIPPTTVYNRVKSLQKQGIIKQYTIKTDDDRLVGEIVGFILVTVKQEENISQRKISKKLLKHENVERVSIITGDHDLLIRCRVKSVKKLNQFILDHLRDMKGISGSKL